MNFVSEQCCRSSGRGGERCGGGWWCSSYEYTVQTSRKYQVDAQTLCEMNGKALLPMRDEMNTLVLKCMECALI